MHVFTRTLLTLLIATLLVAAPAATAAKHKKKSTYVYVHDDGDVVQRVFGFEMAKDGTLTELNGSPYSATAAGNGCGGFCQTLSYSKKRKMLFHGGANSLTVWSVAQDGTLTEVAGSPFALKGNELWGTEVFEQAKRVFVALASPDDQTTVVVEIAKDGTPTEVEDSPLPAGQSTLGVAVAKKKVIVVANQSSDPLSSYRIGRRGSLTPGPENTGSNPDGAWTVSVDPKGKFAYTGDDSLIHPHRIDRRTGAVEVIDGAGIDAGVGDSVNGIVFSKKAPAFVFGYGRNGTNDVAPVKVQKDGTLLPLGAGSLSTGMDSIGAIDFAPNGKILAVAGIDSNALRTFAVAKSDGALTELDTAALTDDPDDITDLQFVKR